jgi:hypothetical protein
MLWSGGFQWLSVNVRGQTVPGQAPGNPPRRVPGTRPGAKMPPVPAAIAVARGIIRGR